MSRQDFKWSQVLRGATWQRAEGPVSRGWTDTRGGVAFSSLFSPPPRSLFIKHSQCSRYCLACKAVGEILDQESGLIKEPDLQLIKGLGFPENAMKTAHWLRLWRPQSPWQIPSDLIQARFFSSWWNPGNLGLSESQWMISIIFSSTRSWNPSQKEKLKSFFPAILGLSSYLINVWWICKNILTHILLNLFADTWKWHSKSTIHFNKKVNSKLNNEWIKITFSYLKHIWYRLTAWG